MRTAQAVRAVGGVRGVLERRGPQEDRHVRRLRRRVPHLLPHPAPGRGVLPSFTLLPNTSRTREAVHCNVGCGTYCLTPPLVRGVLLPSSTSPPTPYRFERLCTAVWGMTPTAAALRPLDEVHLSLTRAAGRHINCRTTFTAASQGQTTLSTRPRSAHLQLCTAGCLA